MQKPYISDHNLEEYIVNLLREKAELKSFNIENFWFKTIIKEIQEKYDIDKSRIENVIDKLEKNGEITVRARIFDVIIPRGYENKFTHLVTKIEPTLIPIISLLVGYLMMVIVYGFLNKEIVVRIGNVIDFNFLIWGFLVPLSVGAIILKIIQKIWNGLYNSITPFKEMVDFFGGKKVWMYALFFSIFFLMLYISLTVFLKFKINPYYVVSILIAIFAGVLFYGSKRKG